MEVVLSIDKSVITRYRKLSRRTYDSVAIQDGVDNMTIGSY